jgi:hypothetical protein
LRETWFIKSTGWRASQPKTPSPRPRFPGSRSSGATRTSHERLPVRQWSRWPQTTASSDRTARRERAAPECAAHRRLRDSEGRRADRREHCAARRHDLSTRGAQRPDRVWSSSLVSRAPAEQRPDATPARSVLAVLVAAVRIATLPVTIAHAPMSNSHQFTPWRSSPHQSILEEPPTRMPPEMNADRIPRLTRSKTRIRRVGSPDAGMRGGHRPANCHTDRMMHPTLIVAIVRPMTGDSATALVLKRGVGRRPGVGYACPDRR